MSALVPAAKIESARKLAGGEIIAGIGEQRVGALAVAARRLQRHHVADRRARSR